MKHHRTRAGIATVLFLFLAVRSVETLMAAEPPNAARLAISPKVAELADMLGNGRIDAMLDRIGPVQDTDRPAWEETRQRLISLYSSAGKYSGFDIAGYKSLTPRYQQIYVLTYFEKRSVLLEFGFYNVDDAWRAQNFHLETDFKAILDTLPLQK